MTATATTHAVANTPSSRPRARSDSRRAPRLSHSHPGRGDPTAPAGTQHPPHRQGRPMTPLGGGRSGDRPHNPRCSRSVATQVELALDVERPGAAVTASPSPPFPTTSADTSSPANTPANTLVSLHPADAAPYTSISLASSKTAHQTPNSRLPVLPSHGWHPGPGTSCPHRLGSGSATLRFPNPVRPSLVNPALGP